MVPPVIIITTPRSGSSLLTKIVAAHGLWVGRHATKNGHGYCDYENIDMKTFVKMNWPRDSRGGVFPEENKRLREHLTQLTPKNKRAVFKGFSPMWRVWITEFPEADFLFCTRDFEDIVASAHEKARQPTSENNVSRFMKHWYDRVHGTARLLRRPVINMGDVVKGDFSVLEEGLSLCGITMDEDLVRRAIDPKLWRHGSELARP